MLLIVIDLSKFFDINNSIVQFTVSKAIFNINLFCTDIIIVNLIEDHSLTNYFIPA